MFGKPFVFNFNKVLSDDTTKLFKTPECSGMFWNVAGCFGMFRNISGCFGMFREVSGYFGIFRNMANCMSLV